MEAASLAGHLKLDKLILLYDSNDVTLDGALGLTNREDITKKFLAMGWNVINVPKGNSYFFCTHAISSAKRSSKPTLIIFKTTIGIGSQKEGTSSAHYGVLTKEELDRFKASLKVKESFYIPSDVRELCMASTRRGKLIHETWNQNLAIYSSTHPELYKSFLAFFDRKKISFERILKNVAKYDGQSLAKVNHFALSELAYQCPQMLGGTADVSVSSMAFIDNAGSFSSGYRRGKNIKFGVREHAMSAICNGIASYEDFITFDASYLSFSNYQLPAIRARSAMGLPVMSFFTHDSIAIGDCGATCQPVEQLGNLRAIIGNTVYRPCDYKELIAGYQLYVKGYVPVSFVLSKQEIEHIEGTSFEGALQGGYILQADTQKPKIILVASGSEVTLAVKLAKELRKKHSVSVVSMPSIEMFEKQPTAYKNKVLPKEAELVVAIEASNDTKWLKVLGRNAELFGINSYVPCGNGADMMEKAGFTVKNLVKFIEAKLKDKNR